MGLAWLSILAWLSSAFRFFCSCFSAVHNTPIILNTRNRDSREQKIAQLPMSITGPWGNAARLLLTT
jgi:hypothetical protein